MCFKNRNIENSIIHGVAKATNKRKDFTAKVAKSAKKDWNTIKRKD